MTPALQLAGHLEADDLRRKNRNRLTEHGRFGFDTAHAPAQHAHAVDGGRMGIGSDERIGIGHTIVAGHDATGEIFHVDLVADAEAGRKHTQLFKRLLAPLEKFVALFVALELAVDIDLE